MTIESTLLDTERVPTHDRFALWREALSATHEATLPEGADPSGFQAYARGWNLGPFLLIETRATAQRLARSPRAIRSDQIDHYVIRLQRHGCWTGEANGRAVVAQPGSVMALDLARPSDAIGTGIENINLLVPREALDTIVPPIDMHGLFLHGATAELLRSHLETLVAALPYMPSDSAPDVARATCSLVAACLAPSRATAARARVPLALARLAEIRRYIDRHLQSPELSPDAVCRALGLSRSTLYATCEPVGGVAALIQRRRLERIHAILTDPGERRRISEIAFQYGFVSKAHFSRAFRNAFGCSPREARDGVPYAAEAPRPPGRYESWLRDLGG
jgi:AraC-like DNA-binding protein